MLPLRKREPGQAIALAAVAAVALVGALAFVVDAGIFLEARRELQTTADHAAEAGVAFLPDCPTNTGGSCGSGNNTQDTVWQYIQNNGPIARQLCGDAQINDVHAAASFSSTPNTGATPGWDLASSIYTPPASIQSPNGFDQAGDYYYRLDVTVRCSPGFTFGRILLGDANQPLQASASAVVGALDSSACSAPINVVANSSTYTTDPGTEANNFGYSPGSGNLPGYTWSSQVTPGLGFGLDTGLQNYPPNSGDVLEVFLPGLGTTGPDWEKALCGSSCSSCVPLSVGEIVTLQSSPGVSIGHVKEGLTGGGPVPGSGRGYVGQGTCPQPTTQVIYTPQDTSDPKLLWTVKPGQQFSPCLWTVAVLDFGSLSNPQKQAAVDGFITVFIQDLGGNGSNSYFEGVVVTQTGSGQTGGFRQNATKSIRLIR